MSDHDTRPRPRKVSMQEGAKCGQSCYVSIFRDGGEMGDNILNHAPRSKREKRRLEALQQLNASHSRTDYAEDDCVDGRKVGGHWVDWYRIPVHENQDFNRIRSTLRYNGISHGGPFWDLTRAVARVATGSGGDVRVGLQKGFAAKKAVVKTVAEQRYPANLMRDLFGRSKTFLRTDPVTGDVTEYETVVMDYGRLSYGFVSLHEAESLPMDWQFGHELWFKILAKYRDFERLWTACIEGKRRGEEWAIDALQDEAYSRKGGRMCPDGALIAWVKAFEGRKPVDASKPQKPLSPELANRAKALAGFRHDNLESLRVESTTKLGNEPKPLCKNPNWAGATSQTYPEPSMCWLMDDYEKGGGI